MAVTGWSAGLHARVAQITHEGPDRQPLADALGGVFIAAWIDHYDPFRHKQRGEWNVSGDRDIVRLRMAELRRAIISGVHSPAKYRTWSVRNHDAWYDAFGVRPGDRMYLAPEERVRIW